jgi:DNA-binding transcriptional ArsR family regulator
MGRQKHKYIIYRKPQMRALAAPTRQEIVEALAHMGSVSVAELAAALGRPADSLYYHLHILKKVGLVLTAGFRDSGGRREELFRSIARDLSLSYQLGKNGNALEVNAIIASMLRLSIRDFARGCRTGDVAVSGPGRELWALRSIAWLSRSQLAKLNRCIHDVLKLMTAPGRQGRLYAVSVVLTPIVRHPRERSNA